MNLRVYKYRGLGNPYGLEAKSTVWILEDDWNILLSNYPVYREERAVANVKIESKDDILNRYSIYAKLVKLPHGSLYTDVGTGMIWIPEELFPSHAFVDNKKSEVEITVLDDIYDANLPQLKDIKIETKDEFNDGRIYNICLPDVHII